MLSIAQQLRDAAVQNEVRSVGRGDEKSLSCAAVLWLRSKLPECITPTRICEALGFSVFEANRLLRALTAQKELADTVKITRRAGGQEWGYSWAKA